MHEETTKQDPQYAILYEKNHDLYIRYATELLIITKAIMKHLRDLVNDCHIWGDYRYGVTHINFIIKDSNKVENALPFLLPALYRAQIDIETNSWFIDNKQAIIDIVKEDLTPDEISNFMSLGIHNKSDEQKYRNLEQYIIGNKRKIFDKIGKRLVCFDSSVVLGKMINDYLPNSYLDVINTFDEVGLLLSFDAFNKAAEFIYHSYMPHSWHMCYGGLVTSPNEHENI